MTNDIEEVEFPDDLPPPPPWKDVEAVAAWAYRMFAAIDNEEEYEFAQRRWDTHPGIPASEIHADMEGKAVERAKIGDFGPLAVLLHPDHLMNKRPIGKSIREALSPATWSLIARKLATGLPKRSKGGQPKTAEQRRAQTDTHDAAAEAERIEDILRNAYCPEQSNEQIRTTACIAVEQRTGVEAGKLANYLERSLDDPRRL